MKLPDFSEYLVGEKLEQEERTWAEGGLYKRNAANVMTAAELFDLGSEFSLVEFGCGSGWVPTVLPPMIHYFGIDKNPDLLELAIHKNRWQPGMSRCRAFLLKDIRKVSGMCADLACSFAVLKHFSLAEWPDIFTIMLKSARHGVFNIKVSAGEAFDEGTEYYDTSVTADMVSHLVASAGKTIARRELIDDLPRGYEAVYYIKGE